MTHDPSSAKLTSSSDDSPVFSKGRDLDALERTLVEWLAPRVGDGNATDVRVGNLELPVGAGGSNETVLFEATWSEGGRDERAEWVLRIHPDQFQLFVDTDFREQFELLSLLHREQLVKVPEMHWYEPDPSVLGQPFFVMSRLAGRVPVSFPPYNRTGWVFDATPAQRRELWDSAVVELARIHTVPVELVQFLDKPQLGATGLEQQLTYWQRSIPWSTGGANPEIVTEIGEWLRTNLPAHHLDGLAWGDARIGNMAFGDDFRLVGVMDWEQASLAGGLHDLGWWLFFDEFHSVDQGVARLDGLGTRAETLDLWQELVSAPTDDLHWHEVFAGFTLIQLTCRALVLRGARIDDDALAANPFLTRTSHLLGRPAPTSH